MYTATKLGDTVDKQSRRRIVTVHFSDGASEFDKDFSFAVETTVDVIKNTVKQYLDEINFVPSTLDGEIAVEAPEATPATPTATELAKTAWDTDRAKLKALMELVQDGVFTGNETQITALQNKVKTGLKEEYLG